jgi:hypothetical protein
MTNFSYFSSWVSFAPVHYLYRNRAIHSPSERRSSRKLSLAPVLMARPVLLYLSPTLCFLLYKSY